MTATEDPNTPHAPNVVRLQDVGSEIKVNTCLPRHHKKMSSVRPNVALIEVENTVRDRQLHWRTSYKSSDARLGGPQRRRRKV